MHNEISHSLIKTKLIELIKSFSAKEFKEFGDFVNSPYFNKEKVLISLYYELKKNYPAFTGSNFSKENIYGSIFPSRKYNDAVFRNVSSKLLTLAEKFLSVQNFLSDDHNYNLSLIKQLKSKNQHKLFEKHFSSINKKLDDVKFKNEDYFSKRYLTESQTYIAGKNKKTSLSFFNENRIKQYDYLLNNLLMQILKANMSIINSNKNIFGRKTDFILLDEIDLYISKNPDLLNENIYLNYYFNSVKLFKSEKEENFNKLIAIVDKNLNHLETSDERDLMTILTNFCYYKINHGELKYKKDQFYLYKKNIETALYKADSSFIPHILFMNVVTCGLDANEFEWIENFIREYKDELREEHQENMYNFSLALFAYQKKDFDKAISFASKIISDEMSYKHQLKSLYLKIFFDINDVQPFYSHIDSYRHFLNNDKELKEENKILISNYILFSKKIFDLKNNPDSSGSDFHILKKEILSSVNVINKAWLLERINV